MYGWSKAAQGVKWEEKAEDEEGRRRGMERVRATNSRVNRRGMSKWCPWHRVEGVCVGFKMKCEQGEKEGSGCDGVFGKEQKVKAAKFSSCSRFRLGKGRESTSPIRRVDGKKLDSHWPDIDIILD